MEYRQLGYTGVRVSALALGTMTFGGRGKFAMVGEVDVDAARRMVERSLDAGVNFIDTADVYSDGRSEEIVGEVIKDPVTRLSSPPRRAMRWVTARTMPGCRVLPPTRLRSESPAPTDRLHRPLPGARTGRRHPDGRDPRHPRHPRPPGEGPLHRVLEPFGMARHEGARHLRAPRLTALRDPADLLLPARPGRRVRAHPTRRRPADGDPDLEPACWWPALRKVPQGQGPPRGCAANDVLGRTTCLRRESDVRHCRDPG